MKVFLTNRRDMMMTPHHNIDFFDTTSYADIDISLFTVYYPDIGIFFDILASIDNVQPLPQVSVLMICKEPIQLDSVLDKDIRVSLEDHCNLYNIEVTMPDKINEFVMSIHTEPINIINSSKTEIH